MPWNTEISFLSFFNTVKYRDIVSFFFFVFIPWKYRNRTVLENSIPKPYRTGKSHTVASLLPVLSRWRWHGVSVCSFSGLHYYNITSHLRGDELSPRVETLLPDFTIRRPRRSPVTAEIPPPIESGWQSHARALQAACLLWQRVWRPSPAEKTFHRSRRNVISANGETIFLNLEACKSLKG